MSASKRILVIGVDPSEAPFRLRMAILPGLLANLGYEFDFRARPSGWAQRRALMNTADQYHAVIVQRKLLDPSHAKLLRRRARKIFYDIDDAVMVQRRKIGRISAILKLRRFLATAHVMDHVVAGNDYLADTFRQMGCKATVLPTVVDPAHYKTKIHFPTDAPALVWIGSRSTLDYLKEAMPAIEAATKRVPGLRLVTIANDTVHSKVVPIKHVKWSEHAEVEGLHEGDIGIAPTPLDRWTIGKCGFKIIQYMASGLPTIASPVGANARIVESGVTGLLPATLEEWPDAIAHLADSKRRARMGIAARQSVEKHYNLQRARDVWAELLKD